MMVLPLRPDLAGALGLQADQLAWLTAAHTTASLLAGLAAMTRLDRFDRRLALLVSLTGLTTALLACAASRCPSCRDACSGSVAWKRPEPRWQDQHHTSPEESCNEESASRQCLRAGAHPLWQQSIQPLLRRVRRKPAQPAE